MDCVLLEPINWKFYVQNFPAIYNFGLLAADCDDGDCEGCFQGGFDGRGQPTASPMLTAIMSGGVVISGSELYKYR